MTKNLKLWKIGFAGASAVLLTASTAFAQGSMGGTTGPTGEQQGSQRTQQEPSSAQQGAKQAEQIQGTVSSVDESNHELRVASAGGQEETLKFDKHTQVFLDGQKVKGLQNVQEGSQVRASYSMEGGEMKATRIDVQSSGAQQPSQQQQRPDYGTQPDMGGSSPDTGGGY